MFPLNVAPRNWNWNSRNQLAALAFAPLEAWTDPLSGFWWVSKLGRVATRRALFFVLGAARTPMPILVYFAIIGSVLVALLFVADSTLEKNVSSPIVTSQRTGLPAPRYHNANAAKVPTTVPAPAPDMTSQDVRAAQPKSAPDALPKIESEAREARAEARHNRRQVEVAKNTQVEATLQNQRPTQVTDHQRKIEPEARDARAESTPQNQRLTQVTDHQQKIESESREPQAEAPPQNYQQNQFDRFSIKGY